MNWHPPVLFPGGGEAHLRLSLKMLAVIFVIKKDTFITTADVVQRLDPYVHKLIAFTLALLCTWTISPVPLLYLSEIGGGEGPCVQIEARARALQPADAVDVQALSDRG